MGDDLCTELTCPAHGEMNRLRYENGGLVDAYEALVAERDALAERLRKADDVARAERERLTALAEQQYDAFLLSSSLHDPWIAGWHAAVRQVVASLRGGAS